MKPTKHKPANPAYRTPLEGIQQGSAVKLKTQNYYNVKAIHKAKYIYDIYEYYERGQNLIKKIIKRAVPGAPVPQHTPTKYSTMGLSIIHNPGVAIVVTRVIRTQGREI